MRVLDGAYGTLLAGMLRGGETVDDLCVRAPGLVIDAHRAYVDAGASSVQTNTFLAHARESTRVRRRLMEAAFACALEAMDGDDASIRVTVGPAGDEPRAWWELLELALDVGATAVQIETLTSRAHVVSAAAAWADVARGVTDVELCLCASVNVPGERTSWDGLVGALGEVSDAVVVGLNCCTGAEPELRRVLVQLCDARPDGVRVLPSAGLPGAVRAPRSWADAMALLVADLPVVAVGGCCQTTSAHIDALAAAV